MTMKTLTETFNKISVAKGDTFEIELYGNASTGYNWDVQVVAGKARLLSHVSEPPAYIAKSNIFAGGGGGNENFVFVAEEAGEIDIKADYKRSWESKPAAKSVSFNISVK